MKSYYIEEGVLKFEELKNDKLQIVTTYDNKIWGNMNPYFAKSEEEKGIISKNDARISELLNTQINFVLTTPPENTICNLNDSAYRYLVDTNSKKSVDPNLPKYINVRANSILIPKKEEKTSIIIAPADCPVVVITDKKRSFVVVMHLGFPQYIQNLHFDTLELAKSYFNLNQELDIFITPYICSEHYLISSENYSRALKQVGFKLEKYSSKIYSEIWKDDRFSIDLKNIIHEEISTRLPNSRIIETGVCTYEEAEKGNMFSHKYVTDQKQLGKEIPEGNFNVIVNI